MNVHTSLWSSSFPLCSWIESRFSVPRFFTCTSSHRFTNISWTRPIVCWAVTKNVVEQQRWMPWNPTAHPSSIMRKRQTHLHRQCKKTSQVLADLSLWDWAGSGNVIGGEQELFGVQDPIARTLLTAGSQRCNFQAFQHLAPITARQVGAGGRFPVLACPLFLIFTYTHIFFLSLLSLTLPLSSSLSPFTPSHFGAFSSGTISLSLSCHSLLISLCSPPSLSHTLSLSFHTLFLWLTHTDPLLFACVFHLLFSSFLFYRLSPSSSLLPPSHTHSNLLRSVALPLALSPSSF